MISSTYDLRFVANRNACTCVYMCAYFLYLRIYIMHTNPYLNLIEPLQTEMHIFVFVCVYLLHTNAYIQSTSRVGGQDLQNALSLGCSVLQCLAACCSVWQCVAVCCSVRQCAAVRCSVLQCVAMWCGHIGCIIFAGVTQKIQTVSYGFAERHLQHTEKYCNALQHTATHCNTLQHTATHLCVPYSQSKNCPKRPDKIRHRMGLHLTATHCNTKQHKATQLPQLQHAALHCNTRQDKASHRSVPR